jgi:hypothetical protein
MLCILFCLSFISVVYPMLPLSRYYPLLITPSILSDVYIKIYIRFSNIFWSTSFQNPFSKIQIAIIRVIYVLSNYNKYIHCIHNRYVNFPYLTKNHFRIDRNFYPQGCVQPDWSYFEWTEQNISINPYKLIQTFFCYDIEKYIYIFFKIRKLTGNKFK